MLNKIRIILINTYHPGNIGATARAMKTMGLNTLYLVEPYHFPAVEADSMAAGAQDILASAQVISTFDEAIKDCSLVIGTSARSRNMSIPMLNPSDCADKLVNESLNSRVALVFGQETMGMTNEDLLKCHYHATIPASSEYSVLNIAAAVQIMCYEIYQYYNHLSETELDTIEQNNKQYPDTKDMEVFYKHLEITLDGIGFLIRQHPGQAMTRLKRFFNRARPETKELRMLRGILSAAQKHVK